MKHFKSVSILFLLIGLGALCQSSGAKITAHLDWQSFSDVVAGGTSSAQLTAPDPKNKPKNIQHAVKLQGELTQKFAFPFAGAHAFFNADKSITDVSQYSGVQFWVRGDGRTYGVQILSAGIKDYNYYSQVFKTSDSWILVRIPFKEMKQMIPGAAKVDWSGADAQGVGFQASGFLGPYWLEIGDVQFF